MRKEVATLGEKSTVYTVKFMSHALKWNADFYIIAKVK